MAAPIVIAVGLNTTDARQAAQQLASEIRSALNGVAADSRQAGRNINDALTRSLRETSQNLSRQLAGIGQQLSIKLSLPLAGIGAAALKAAADLDKSRQTLTALTGSVENANRKLVELRELAQRSPGVTTSFASELFGQFKALGTIADSSINRVIASLGKLNAVFSLQDPGQFARNLQQIFTQGFERSDIKEALGQVPIFEQLLEQAFGTKDANKLRQLKEAGTLTAETYFTGIVSAIDQRFPKVQESILAKFQKTKDQLLVSLAPVGEALLRTLQPVIDRIIPQILSLLDAFSKLSPATQELIVKFGLFAAAFGPVLSGLSSMLGLLSSVFSLVGAIGGAGLLGSLVALNPVVIGLGVAAAGAVGGWFLLNQQMKETQNQADLILRKQREASGEFVGLTGEPVTRRGGRFIDAQKVREAQLAAGQSNTPLSTSGVNLLTGEPTRPSLSNIGAGTASAKAAQESRRIIEDASKLKEALIRLEQDRVEQTSRILDQEIDMRRKTLKSQFDAGLVEYKDYLTQRAALDEQASALEVITLQKEIELIKNERAQLEVARSSARGVDKVNIERELLRLYTDQTIKVNELTNALNANVQASIKRVQSTVQLAGGDINAPELVRLDVPPPPPPETFKQFQVQLTDTQRFLRGFNNEIETTGDAFERLGQNLSRSFAGVSGLLQNLKQSFLQFFRDMLGMGLQRIFSQLLSGITGALTGQRGPSGGGAAATAGGILGNITGGGGGIFGGGIFGGGGGGFLTPGFGGGFPGIISGGGLSSIGGLPFANMSNIGALGQASLFGKVGNAGLLAGLGGLFKGFGFGKAAGSARGGLAAIAPLLGAQLGAGLGGQSRLGQILGGVGGAALGIGITAAPALLTTGALAGSLGFLAPLFSNPITAVVGGALLVGSLLLGRSQQRRNDEQQSGVWLQDAINQINQLKEQVKSGRVGIAEARQIFESQILGTFIAQIQTLKTKSVRDSRLTNQVRDLRNLFESTIVPAANEAKRSAAINDKLIPEFATGGIVPGLDRGYDSVMARVRPGEMVLTRSQQSAIESMAGPGIFRAAGVPEGAHLSSSGYAFANGGMMRMASQIAKINTPNNFVPTRGLSDSMNMAVRLTLVVGREDASRLVVSGQTTSVGQRATLNIVKKAILNREF